MNPYKVHVYRQPPSHHRIAPEALQSPSLSMLLVLQGSASHHRLQYSIESGWWCNNHLGKHEFVNGKDDNPYIYIYHGKSNSCSNHQPGNMTWIIWGWIFGKPPGIPMYTPRCSGRNEMERWHQNLLPSSFEELFLAHFVSDFGTSTQDNPSNFPRMNVILIIHWSNIHWLWKIPELTKIQTFFSWPPLDFPKNIQLQSHLHLLAAHLHRLILTGHPEAKAKCWWNLVDLR